MSLLPVTFRPLTWVGRDTPDDERRSRGTFSASWTNTLIHLDSELRKLDASNVVIEADFRDYDIRNDGYPRANARQPIHPGVRVAFESRHGPLIYQTDVCRFWQHNVRSIALGLQALRAVDRYGVSMRGEQYTGWRALPAGRGDASGMTATDAAEILLRASNTEFGHADRETFRAQGVLIVRRARAATHPDQNDGDTAQWNLVDNAAQTLRQAGWLPKEVTS